MAVIFSTGRSWNEPGGAACIPALKAPLTPSATQHTHAHAQPPAVSNRGNARRYVYANVGAPIPLTKEGQLWIALRKLLPERFPAEGCAQPGMRAGVRPGLLRGQSVELGDLRLVGLTHRREVRRQRDSHVRVAHHHRRHALGEVCTRRSTCAARSRPSAPAQRARALGTHRRQRAFRWCRPSTGR